MAGVGITSAHVRLLPLASPPPVRLNVASSANPYGPVITSAASSSSPWRAHTSAIVGPHLSALLASALVAGISGRRRHGSQRRYQQYVPLIARLVATEEAPTQIDTTDDAAPRRRRRRRREPSADVEDGTTNWAKQHTEKEYWANDLVFREKAEAKCDCENILGTMVEVEELLTPRECDRLVLAAERHAAVLGWGAKSHEYSETQDVKVCDLREAGAADIFKSKVVEPMMELVGEHFNVPAKSVTVDDAFIVRYSCTKKKGQKELSAHRDGSLVSSIISLSPRTNYTGGGTVFADNDIKYTPDQGGAIVFAGQRLHAGLPIESGDRYIMTIFMKVGEACCRSAAVQRESGVAGQMLAEWGLI